MVLSSVQRNDGVTVNNRQDTRFLPFETFFNHNLTTSITKGSILKNRLASRSRFGTIPTDKDPLARCQPVSLYDQRSFFILVNEFDGFAQPSKTWKSAVGTFARRSSFFVKTLLPSSLAAAADGPKTAKPAFRNSSDRPATSGASGPPQSGQSASLLQNAEAVKCLPPESPHSRHPAPFRHSLVHKYTFCHQR